MGRVAEPLRLDGRRRRRRRGRPPAPADRGDGIAGDRLSAAGRLRPGQVVPAARRAARPTGRRSCASSSEPATTRERMLSAAGAALDRSPTGRRCRRRPRRPQSRSSPPPGSQLPSLRVAGDLSSAAFHLVAALLVPGSAVTLDRRRAQPDARRSARHPDPHGGADRGRRAGLRGRRAGRQRDGPRRRPRGHEDRRRRGAAGDRRAAAARARRLLRRGRDGRHGGRGAAPQGVGSDRDGRRRGSARSAPTSRRCPTASSSAATAACAAARSPRPAITGSRCSGPSPGSPREEGVTVDGMEAAAISYPGFEADLASLVH